MSATLSTVLQNSDPNNAVSADPAPIFLASLTSGSSTTEEAVESTPTYTVKMKAVTKIDKALIIPVSGKGASIQIIVK